MSAQTVAVSSSAIGLYILNVIAAPTPSSARFNTDSMDVNRLLSPVYAMPSVYMSSVRITNGIARLYIFDTVPNTILRTVFFDLSSFILCSMHLSDSRMQKFFLLLLYH